jgi:hypothetical protein
LSSGKKGGGDQKVYLLGPLVELASDLGHNCNRKLLSADDFLKFVESQK